MIAFIDQLDYWFGTYVSAKYPAITMRSSGFCEQVFRTVDSRSTPLIVSINGTSNRDNITLDKRFDLITWFRLISPVTKQNNIEGNDWGFGFNQDPVQKATLFWFLAWKVELGEELPFTLIENIPASLRVQGYQIASVDRSSISIDPDHEKIYRQELGDTVYEKHRFPWNIVGITMNLEYIINPLCNPESCEDCPENTFVTQSGDCLIPN